MLKQRIRTGRTVCRRMTTGDVIYSERNIFTPTSPRATSRNLFSHGFYASAKTFLLLTTSFDYYVP
jgi:hypothetical protein